MLENEQNLLYLFIVSKQIGEIKIKNKGLILIKVSFLFFLLIDMISMIVAMEIN